MIDYLVIDDELSPRELLIYKIRDINLPFNLVGEGKNLIEGIELIKKLKPKVVFLDIQMPNFSGLKIREFLNEDELNFKLVFVTAYDKYAIQAIRLSAFDYLLKPIEKNELKDCLNRILEENTSSNDTYHQLLSLDDDNILVVNSHKGANYIKINDIISITANGMYSKFQLKDKILISSKPLKTYQEIHHKLFRCHRSYIVNLDYVQEIKGQFIMLKNKEVISVSRQNKKKLINSLK